MVVAIDIHIMSIVVLGHFPLRERYHLRGYVGENYPCEPCGLIHRILTHVAGSHGLSTAAPLDWISGILGA